MNLSSIIFVLLLVVILIIVIKYLIKKSNKTCETEKSENKYYYANQTTLPKKL